MYPYPIFLGMNLYDIALTVAILTALFLCDKMIQKRQFSVALQRIVLIGVLGCVLLGLLSAFLFQAFYDFLETGSFQLNSNTGITFYGGLIGGTGFFLLIWFFGGKFFLKGPLLGEEKKKFPDMLDIAACCVPLAHGIGRLGCFAAGCCHGAETDAWYGIKMLTETGWKTVVPVQLFEAVFLFLLAAFLFWAFYKKERKFPLMPIYCGVYGCWRFFVEYLRADDRGASFFSGLSPSQLTALILIIFSIVWLVLWFYKKKVAQKKGSVSE